MNKHFTVLELDKILNMLSKETTCPDACEMALRIEPAHTLREVNRLLAETSDAHMLIGRFGMPSFGGVKSVTNSLRRAQAGGALTMKELLRIAEVLRIIRSLSQWRQKSAGINTVLDSRFEALVPNKYLEEKITSSILSEEEMADSASVTLAGIRRKIVSASSKVRDILDKMIRSQTYEKYLQDAIVTMRGGRYVVPVKAEFKGQINGLVHDTSSSGATLFVEPMGVVDVNNEIKVLRIKEQEEIEHILLELSAEAGSFADIIIGSYENLVELNLILAKAELAFKMKASMPVMNESGIIDIKKARHPLIDSAAVVPTDIKLGEDFDTLVITGPNTGGKTVSLKTLGLLTLMAMCGLMIPAADNSRLSVFNNILADIGDEQSIEQSLSTFSAHMTNISEILKTADESSLVLIDELGAGTDPVEGAALAIAILEKLKECGAKTASTTHYAELKAYAIKNRRVENACCEFDVSSLRPTYKLLIGVAGRSNAFAISKRLGISDDIIERANNLVSEESRDFEQVMQTLESKRQELEDKLKQAHSTVNKARKDRELASKELEKVKKTADEEIKRAREEALRISAKTKAQAYALLDELEALKKKNKELSSEDKARLRAGIKAMDDSADPVIKNKNSGYKLPRKLKVGDNVLIFDIDKKGIVLKEADASNEVLVQAGIIKTKVKLDNLRLLEEKQQKPVVRSATRNVRSVTDIKAVTEVDLRGMTAVEAIMELDNAIDSAVLSNIGQITVIHGKGTGVLRKEVHAHLKHHKAIKEFRLGVFGEGENGVTIATLK
ncbi:MAG: endonuclease MutS2 [Acutalibacteraceae bacterium]